MSFKKILARITLLAMIGGFLLIGGVRSAEARDRDNACEQQMRNAEANYQKAVRKHGEHSKQANKRRQQMEQVRDRCRGEQKDHDRGHDHGHDHDQDRR